jgi:hypothetical protein
MIAKRALRFQHTSWFGMTIWYLSLLETTGYQVRASRKLFH